jgi:putrescine transport system ATP-binding protein
VQELSYFGSHTVFHLKLASGAVLKVSMANTERQRQNATWGDAVWASWSDSAHVVLTQ